ncbi:hypothetical protein M3Y97_00668200 [Aphelenchoides bicaudatus]|nr:hypothetical protein M3Y97_00668200 [Aphelenchoides bicaudatus]
MSIVSTHFIKWPIGKFHETAARNGPGKVLPSNVFDVGDLKFQMRFHPTNQCSGFSEHHSSIYLSVLNLKNEEKFAMQYRLWIENVDGLVLKKFDLEDTFKKSKQCYGIAEFAQHDHLYAPESQFVKDDIIFVCCEICDIKFDPQPSTPSTPTSPLTPTTPTTFHQTRIRFNIPPKNEAIGECTLKVDDKEFNVQKALLIRKSKIFERMILASTTGSETGPIRIHNASVPIVEAFLKFLYTGSVDNLNQVAKDLFVFACTYEVQSLADLCVVCMAQSLNKDNILERLVLAFEYNIDWLKYTAMNYVLSPKNEHNFQQILKTKTWNKFAYKNEKLAAQIIDKFFEKAGLAESK